MTKDTAREERLAAKLRENLRRRKVQGKALAGDAPSESLPQPDSPSLSNPAADR
ncbi:MAG: hypothetical protein JY451_06855 [Erythrobacter sp.]|nr:MAG: hypothetical protein JY451_06855 [Erythrobacter sp.]